MYARYPNLELIEFKADLFANKFYPDLLKQAHTVTHEMEVFMQTWPTTSLGFDIPGTVSGQAFTSAYTTVVKMTLMNREIRPLPDTLWAVFFGNNFAYIVLHDNDEFMNDLKNRNMKSQKDCHEYMEQEDDRDS